MIMRTGLPTPGGIGTGQDGRSTTWTRDLSEKDRVAEVHHRLTGDGIGESDLVHL